MNELAKQLVLAIDAELRKDGIQDIEVARRAAITSIKVIKQQWSGLVLKKYEELIEEINNLN